MSDSYDFSHGKRGVFYERAKAGVVVHKVSDAEDKSRTNKNVDPADQKKR